jgi:2-polyprenyl-3-methyl-5-hydroxy-6-metoxy-1,4-benzoquinol methylase
MEPITRVDETVWDGVMDRFINIYRKTPRPQTAPSATPSEPPYKTFAEMVHIGKTVLDVGCGPCILREFMPKGTDYYGIDAFPIAGIEGIREGKIEDIDLQGEAYDTVFCFAMLDSVQDLGKTLNAVNRMAKHNVAILTGIGIEPDQYHTLLLTEDMLVAGLPDFEIKLKYQTWPKCFLYDFHRKGITL